MSDISDFEEDDLRQMPSSSAFVVDVEGYEGPIDVLLSLARNQKVDLIHISIVELADQYLKFVDKVSSTNLELAADYLVMAAWLAYLKSRLLLPDMNSEEEPSGEALAAALQFQLQRLESMQKAGADLMGRARLGKDFYSRGAPERFKITHNSVFEASLADLIQAYAYQRSKATKGKTLHIETSWELSSIENALVRLRRLVGHTPNWLTLARYLPKNIDSPLSRRSNLATTFGAVLQLVKEGRLNVRQDGTFGEIHFQTTQDWDKPFVHDQPDQKDEDDA